MEYLIESAGFDAWCDEPFAAAFATRIVMDAHGLVQGYSYWTFSDIFSENYFPSVPFHGGFGLLNLYGIAKPAYRAFQCCTVWAASWWKYKERMRQWMHG